MKHIKFISDIRSSNNCEQTIWKRMNYIITFANVDTSIAELVKLINRMIS